MPSGERWNVEITDEYLRWFAALEEEQQDAIRADIGILEQIAPHLGRPYVDSIKGSKLEHEGVAHDARPPAYPQLLCV